MAFISSLIDRALPALLMASSVVLLSAGLFSYAPVVVGEDAAPTVLDPGDPNFPTPTDIAVGPTPTAPLVDWPSPTATIQLPSGWPSPSASPSGATSPSESPPLGTLPTDPAATPTATSPSDQTPAATRRPPAGRAFASRIVVPSLGIDLPVVAGNLVVPGNRNFYPLCDVAQYLMEYSQPGERGTTYLYAHARTGMFLPLLEQSQRNNGRGMIGSLVEVYTTDNRLHLYEIYIVKRHATDLALAHQLPPAGHQLIMQTSEGPRGTVPKLQVAARPLSVVPADPDEANPRARPKVCR